MPAANCSQLTGSNWSTTDLGDYICKLKLVDWLPAGHQSNEQLGNL